MSRGAESDGPLDRVEVVLVDPQGPRNVGAVARAMRNFGLRRLCLVRGVDPTHPDSLEAGVHSHALLEGARCVETVDEALDPAGYVVATTGKPRDRLAPLSPREAAPQILEHAVSNRVALLFGKEDHGLDGADLRKAHGCIAIRTAPECRALNLAQAVLLIAYELFGAAQSTDRVAWSDPGRLALGEMRRHLKDELHGALRATGIEHPGTEIACRQSLERIIVTAPLQGRDARLLFALARRIQQIAGSRAPEDEGPHA